MFNCFLSLFVRVEVSNAYVNVLLYFILGFFKQNAGHWISFHNAVFKKPKILDNARSSTLGKRSRIAILLEKKHHMFYHIPVYNADKEFPWPGQAHGHDATNTNTEHHFMVCLNTRNI